MTDLPGFSSPDVWIAKVMTWSKMPFALFPMRFSGWLVVKRGRDAEVFVRVSHQWVRGVATSITLDIICTILRQGKLSGVTQ